MDENDLLATNQFIKEPELDKEIPDEFNEEFRKYYKSEIEKQEEKKIRENVDRMSIRSVHLDEDTDANSIINTNIYQKEGDGIKGSSIHSNEIKRTKKNIKTFVSIDSRDRNRVSFPKPNKFKIFLGRTFYNVKTIKLASIEFPNTNAVINSSNNKIYWRNQQDIDEDIIDNVTGTYPIYEMSVRIGSYISTSLQSEISNKLGLIRRENNNVSADFHSFNVSLDLDTDIVSLISLLRKSLPNNPFTSTSGTGTITVTTVDPHGYEDGQKIYISGAKTFASIPANILNTFHIISVASETVFSFEVSIAASETSLGGGNVVKSGIEAPFQLLFGENNNTIAQNLGYPLENSSERDRVFIKQVENFPQVKIKTIQNHGFQNNNTYLNNLVQFSGIPSIIGSKVLTKVIDSNTFLINHPEIETIFNTGTVEFPIGSGKILDIESASTETIEHLLVSTFTDHNYKFHDIGKQITLYNTNSDNNGVIPSIDGNTILQSVLTNSSFTIYGNVLQEINLSSSEIGDGGYIPVFNPLTTSTLSITGAVSGLFTQLTVPNHNLRSGDFIRLYNLICTPPISNLNQYRVVNVIDSNNFTLNLNTTNIVNDSIINGEARLGTQIINMYFPSHGFNNIISIKNTTQSVSHSSGSTLVVQTFLPHNLNELDYKVENSGIFEGNNKRIRLNNTNNVLINGGYGYDDGFRVISSDTFIINKASPLVSEITTGTIGMSNQFYLYGVSEVDYIPEDHFNNILFDVREIIDENNFTFSISGDFSKTSTDGGGSNVYISSLRHGFSGIQENTKNSLLNRSINLEGENYAFLCCPQLSTMLNTGNIKNVFARITLDQSPGSMVFSYLSNPKNFDEVTLDKLDELEFSIINYDNTLYEFNDLDYSFVLEITEEIDVTEAFNYSSRRGISSNTLS
jgi:hypothetical protein